MPTDDLVDRLVHIAIAFHRDAEDPGAVVALDKLDHGAALDEVANRDRAVEIRTNFFPGTRARKPSPVVEVIMMRVLCGEESQRQRKKSAPVVVFQLAPLPATTTSSFSQ